LCLEKKEWGRDSDVILAALNALNSLNDEPLIFDKSDAQEPIITELKNSIDEWDDPNTFSERMRSAAVAIEAEEETCDLLKSVIPAAGLMLPPLDTVFGSRLKERYTRYFSSSLAYHSESSRVPIQVANHTTRIVGGRGETGREILMEDLITCMGDTGSSSSISPKKICIEATPAQAYALLGRNLMNSWAKGEIWKAIETVYYIRKKVIESNRHLVSTVAECCYSAAVGSRQDEYLYLLKHIEHRLESPKTLVVVDLMDETVRLEDGDLYSMFDRGSAYNLLFICQANSSSIIHIPFDLKVISIICRAVSYLGLQVKCDELSIQEQNNLIELMLGGDEGQAFRERQEKIDNGAELLKCPLTLLLLCKEWKTFSAEPGRFRWISAIILRSVVEEIWRVFGIDHAVSAELEEKVLSCLEKIAIKIARQKIDASVESEGQIAEDFLQAIDIATETRRTLLTCGFLIRSDSTRNFCFPNEALRTYFTGLAMSHSIGNSDFT